MADLERDLRELGAAVDWPDVDVAASVAAELRAGRAARRPLPPFALWPRRRVIALVVAALLLITGTAVAARIAIGSVTIRTVPGLSPSPSAPARSILGRRFSLPAASTAAGLAIQMPSTDTSLGAPDAVYVGGAPIGKSVSLVWNAAAGAPHLDDTGWSALLMEFVGADPGIAVKQVLAKTGLEPVHVGTAPGYWIEGPHQLVLPGGGTLRLGGTVLIWARNGITYRLESNLSKAEAVALARTVP